MSICSYMTTNQRWATGQNNVGPTTDSDAGPTDVQANFTVKQLLTIQDK